MPVFASKHSRETTQQNGATPRFDDRIDDMVAAEHLRKTQVKPGVFGRIVALGNASPRATFAKRVKTEPFTCRMKSAAPPAKLAPVPEGDRSQQRSARDTSGRGSRLVPDVFAMRGKQKIHRGALPCSAPSGADASTGVDRASGAGHAPLPSARSIVGHGRTHGQGNGV